MHHLPSLPARKHFAILAWVRLSPEVQWAVPPGNSSPVRLWYWLCKAPDLRSSSCRKHLLSELPTTRVSLLQLIVRSAQKLKLYVVFACWKTSLGSLLSTGRNPNSSTWHPRTFIVSFQAVLLVSALATSLHHWHTEWFLTVLVFTWVVHSGLSPSTSSKQCVLDLLSVRSQKPPGRIWSSIQSNSYPICPVCHNLPIDMFSPPQE